MLLDVLSDPAGEFGDPSLNTYLTPASDRVAFVGQAVGNVTAHEAGHFFGDWHVDQFNDVANLMDQGGNFPRAVRRRARTGSAAPPTTPTSTSARTSSTPTRGSPAPRTPSAGSCSPSRREELTAGGGKGISSS